jgi:hypothetical protein
LNHKRVVFLWVGIILIGFLGFSPTRAQTLIADSTQAKVETETAADSEDGEMMLGVIEIKGKVEKPGVIIMPKRVEPEIAEMDLERSFNKEVKEGVGEIPKPEKELRRVDRIESIKKTVERKRK